MIILRTRNFAVPIQGLRGIGGNLGTGMAGTVLSKTNKLAAQPWAKKTATSALSATKRPVALPKAPTPPRTMLGPISTAAKRATPPSKAVNMAKNTFKPSVTAAKPVAGFNPTMTFM